MNSSLRAIHKGFLYRITSSLGPLQILRIVQHNTLCKIIPPLSQFWQRQSNTYSFLWNTYTLSPADELRQEFHGYPSVDPVTHQPNIHYPAWRRRLWYLFSVAAMLPLLSLGVATMTLSLNLNGYVKSTGSLIYVESLAKYAQPVSSQIVSVSDSLQTRELHKFH